MKGFFVLGTFRFQSCLTLFSTLKNWKMVRKRRSSAKNAFFFFVGTLCNLQFFRNFSVTKVVLLTFEIYSKLDHFEFLAPKIIKKLPKNENWISLEKKTLGKKKNLKKKKKFEKLKKILKKNWIKNWNFFLEKNWFLEWCVIINFFLLFFLIIIKKHSVFCREIAILVQNKKFSFCNFLKWTSSFAPTPKCSSSSQKS